MAKSRKKPQIKRKSVQQQIWRLQNKLDEKRIPIERRRELEGKLKKAKKSIGYTEPTKREVERYAKERRSVSSKKSRLNKEFRDSDTTQKRRNEIRKELMQISRRRNEISRNLNEKVKKAPKKESPKITAPAVSVSEERPWVVKPEYLDPAIKRKTVKTFIINTERNGKVSVNIKDADEVYDEWFILDSEAVDKYGSNAVIVIIQDAKRKTMELYLKETDSEDEL